MHVNYINSMSLDALSSSLKYYTLNKIEHTLQKAMQQEYDKRSIRLLQAREAKTKGKAVC